MALAKPVFRQNLRLTFLLLFISPARGCIKSKAGFEENSEIHIIVQDSLVLFISIASFQSLTSAFTARMSCMDNILANNDLRTKSGTAAFFTPQGMQ
jgi:hypothetical protein